MPREAPVEADDGASPFADLAAGQGVRLSLRCAGEADFEAVRVERL